MKKVAIQDANIMIDLVKTGLFGYCLNLQYQFSTTDIILNELYEEQIGLIQPHIDSGKFLLIRISEEDLTEIQLMAIESNRLSEQDWSAIYYALQEDAVLLSGDRHLRRMAESKGILVYGVLWILEELVNTGKLLKSLACSILKDLMTKNKRLPANECEKRIELWCGSKTKIHEPR